MSVLRSLLSHWPGRIAFALSAVNPAIFFFFRFSAPSTMIEWFQIILPLPLLYLLLGSPAFIAMAFMEWAKRQSTRWVVLAIAAGASFWAARIISFPFKTASSMAISTMIAAMIAAGFTLIAAALALFVEGRMR